MRAPSDGNACSPAHGSHVGELAPPEIAQAIVAALIDHRATGHGDAGDNAPGRWHGEPMAR